MNHWLFMLIKAFFVCYILPVCVTTSYLAAYDADEHASIRSKLHCPFVRYSACHFNRLYHWGWNDWLLSLYSLFGYLKLTGWLRLTFFWLRYAFAARGSLSTMLNTSFGGSDVDDDNGDSCETGGSTVKTEILHLRYVQRMDYCSLYLCMVYPANYL